MPRRGRSGDGVSPNRPPKRPRENPESSRITAALNLRGRSSRRARLNEADLLKRLGEIEESAGLAKATTLSVESVDLLQEQNGKEHHTDEYDEYEGLVIRRGAAFNLDLHTNEPFDKDQHELTVKLAFGKQPSKVKGTLVTMAASLGGDGEAGKWSARISKTQDKITSVKITSPPTARVGLYKLYIMTETKQADDGSPEVWEKKFDDKIVIIFNPWHPDDAVYLADEKERFEYVLNETGSVYGGSTKHPQGWAWYFGQFDKVVLEAALFLLDKGKLADSARSSPVFISRMLSKMSNDFEDEGVLAGRWEPPWPKEATKPWEWTGSVAILQQYMDSGGEPVQFGQCWVFSAVITTLCRSLGIPTRSVTNFDSAHDHDMTMTIDYFLDDEGEVDRDLSDSVWNFHVWNECWFKRSDLPQGYDGWQAVDATPQELSDGAHQCGPAPVKAIKEGNVYLPHDAPFIFSEVNGDRVYWEKSSKQGKWKIVRRDTHSVGSKIYTKAVGSSTHQDLVHDYKYPEGSEKERDVIRKAMSYANKEVDMEDYVREELEEMYERQLTLTVDLPDDGVVFGRSIDIKVTVENKSSEERKVTGKLSLTGNLYTGTRTARVKSMEYEATIPAEQSDTQVYTLQPKDYTGKVNVFEMLVAFAKIHSEINGKTETYIDFDEEMISPPKLLITAPAEAEMREEFPVEVKFTNTSPFRISGGLFKFEGRGMTTKEEAVSGVIKPEEEYVLKMMLSFRRAGNRSFSVRFSADRVEGLTGTAEVRIRYPS